ncbi:MAG: hypothetical protein IQL11_01270, partial [Bacteroidales bacterium]|nr:hypothetical protein [Bacteroidales bacterium]
MRFPFIIISVTFLLAGLSSSAQYYDTGQDPARLKWLQIKTGRFTVIYPEKYGTGGIEFARSLDEAYSRLSLFYPEKKFRIPIIIHNFTTQSNGYVAWAPKRMEVYPTPEQNTIPLDANRQLALHELTHVLQMRSLSTGLSKVMSVPFGEQFPGVVSALLPLWFLEGDAVFNESVLSSSGRGRSPAFEKQMKAVSVDRGKLYKYDKIVNGSFREYIPDHYRTGYEIVAWTHARYNRQTWNKVLRFSANQFFTIDPVNVSLLGNTGLTKRKLYLQTFDTLKSIWSEEISLKGPESYEILNKPKGKDFANYFSPVRVGENKFVAVRTSLYRPPEFVLLDGASKTEKRIQSPGNLFPYFISSAQRVILWVETQPDPRWENRNYSVIKYMDIRDRIIKQLTWRTRYMSASVSPDGKTVAAVENTVDNRNNLVLLNLGTGKVARTIPAPDNAALQRPQWSEDGTKITLISLTTDGEGILSFRLSDQTWETLLKETTDDFQASFLRHDSLFFVSSSSGTENIYVMPKGKSIIRLTNSKFGATDFILDGGTIIFCDYTISGNNICAAELKSITPGKAGRIIPAFLMADKVKVPDLTKSTLPSATYTPEKYRKWLHLFRFHSWLPFYADLEEIKEDPTAIRPGVTLFSQNQLSTLISSFGYEYYNERHKFHSQITWKGWYPVYEGRIDYGDQPGINKMGSDVGNPTNIRSGIYFTNTLSLPLTFSAGKFRQFFRPSFSAVYQNNYIYNREDSIYDYGQTQINGRFYFSNYHTSSLRDIYPRWAQVVDLNFTLYPFDKQFYGSGISLRTAFYFPGFLRNHGIKLRYENDFQTIEKFLMPNRIDLPRGYKNIISEEINFVSADYVMPLLCPDFNIWSLFYLKRIRAGLFYDYARGTNNYYLRVQDGGGLAVDYVHKYAESFSSVGFEALADFHLLRLPYMVSAGVQAAWQRGAKT